MITVRLIDDQHVTALLRGEGIGILITLLHPVDITELFLPVRLWEEAITEGLEAQENTPCTHHQL